MSGGQLKRVSSIVTMIDTLAQHPFSLYIGNLSSFKTYGFSIRENRFDLQNDRVTT